MSLSLSAEIGDAFGGSGSQRLRVVGNPCFSNAFQVWHAGIQRGNQLAQLTEEALALELDRGRSGGHIVKPTSEPLTALYQSEHSTRVPFRTSFSRRLPQTVVVTTSSSTTIDVVAARPLTSQVEAAYLVDHNRRRPPGARPLRRALDVLMDVGALVLVVWLIPFVILAISSPIVLTLWAVLALIHRL